MNKIILSLMALFLTCTFSYAAPAGVLDEFNGVKWGSKLPQKGFALVLKSDATRFYSRKSDDLYGIPVTELIYTTNKGVFNAAHAVLDPLAYKLVRQYLTNNYGKPVNVADRELFVVRSNGRTTRAMLQQGLVNFTFQKQ